MYIPILSREKNKLQIPQLLLLFSLLLPPSAMAENLRDAVTAALEAHPRVVIAHTETVRAGHLLDEIRARRLPAVDLTASLTGRGQTATGERLPGSPLSSHGEVAGLTLQHSLWDGGRLRGEMGQQAFLQDAARYGVLQARQEIALAAAIAYVDVLNAQALLLAARQNGTALAGHVAKVRERVRSGVSPEADIWQAQGLYAESQSLVQQRLGDLRRKKERYQSIVGHAPDDLVAALPALGNLPQTLQEALLIAGEHHPGFPLAQAQQNAAEEATRAARGDLRPQVRVELTGDAGNRSSGGDGAGQLVGVLAVRQALFDGGGRKARIRALKAQEAIAAQNANLIAREVAEKVGQAWHRLQAQQVSLRYAREHEVLMGKTLNAYAMQFDIGRRSLYDLLQIQNSLHHARSTVISSEYAIHLAQYELLASTGLLIRALGIDD